MADEDKQASSSTSRDNAAQSKALDSLTDTVPEERAMDASKVQEAMKKLAAAQKAEKEAKLKREKELAAVKVDQDSINVLAHEFDVDKRAAETRLRECGGDLYAALKSYL